MWHMLVLPLKNVRLNPLDGDKVLTMLYSHLRKGTVSITVEADKEADGRHYLLKRIENRVAQGSIEIPKGKEIPLEYNLAGLNAISLEKGCYIDQQHIARTHHHGVIRKRLIPLKFVDENDKEQAVAPGSDVMFANGRSTEAKFIPCHDNRNVRVKAIKQNW